MKKVQRKEGQGKIEENGLGKKMMKKTGQYLGWQGWTGNWF